MSQPSLELMVFFHLSESWGYKYALLRLEAILNIYYDISIIIRCQCITYHLN